MGMNNFMNFYSWLYESFKGGVEFGNHGYIIRLNIDFHDYMSIHVTFKDLGVTMGELHPDYDRYKEDFLNKIYS